MDEKIKEVLTNAHRDIREDVLYYTNMRNTANNENNDAPRSFDDPDAIERRLYHYKAAAHRVDALIRELLMSDLEGTFDDTFKITLQRYHEWVNKDLAYFTDKYYDVAQDAPQDEKDKCYDKKCRYALIAERVDSLISDILLADLG